MGKQQATVLKKCKKKKDGDCPKNCFRKDDVCYRSIKRTVKKKKQNSIDFNRWNSAPRPTATRRPTQFSGQSQLFSGQSQPFSGQSQPFSGQSQALSGQSQALSGQYLPFSGQSQARRYNNENSNIGKYALRTAVPLLGLKNTINKFFSKNKQNGLMGSKPVPMTGSVVKLKCRRGALPVDGLLGGYLPDTDPSVGDYFDVMCVAMGIKPLAAFDESEYGRKLVRNRRLDLGRINQIIDTSLSKDVKILHYKGKATKNYMKSVAFLNTQANQNKAIQLLSILHGVAYPTGNETDSDVVYYIGHLLGYDDKNIKRYIEMKYPTETFTNQNIQICKNNLKNFAPRFKQNTVVWWPLKKYIIRV
jgi:hypothetical protein